jgi:hypothetical protein
LRGSSEKQAATSSRAVQCSAADNVHLGTRCQLPPPPLRLLPLAVTVTSPVVFCSIEHTSSSSTLHVAILAHPSIHPPWTSSSALTFLQRNQVQCTRRGRGGGGGGGEKKNQGLKKFFFVFSMGKENERVYYFTVLCRLLVGNSVDSSDGTLANSCVHNHAMPDAKGVSEGKHYCLSLALKELH